MADCTIGGLTCEHALTWLTTVMGSGWGGALLLAWLKARSEGRKQDAAPAAPAAPPAPAPTPAPAHVPPEGCVAIAAGIADRYAVEQLDRIETTLGRLAESLDRIEETGADRGRALERLFQALGRGVGDVRDLVARETGRITDVVERVLDELRKARREVEDLRRGPDRD